MLCVKTFFLPFLQRWFKKWKKNEKWKWFFYRKLNDLMHFRLHEWIMKLGKILRANTMDFKLDS